MYDVVECPWPTLTPPYPERVKVGAMTFRVIVVVADKLPDVPVMVS
jgi:hypothetical protein